MSKKILELILENERKLVELEAIEPTLLKIVKSGVVPILADEPSRYFYEECEKEYWDEYEEFQNVAPPYPVLWFEWKSPRFMRSEVHGLRPWPAAGPARLAVLMSSVERRPDEPPHERFRDARWLVRADVFPLHHNEEAPIRDLPFQAWTFYYGVQPNGRLVLVPSTEHSLVDPDMPKSAHSGDVMLGMPSPFLSDRIRSNYPIEYDTVVREFAAGYAPVVKIAMLSVFLMHAKGTELKVQHVPPELRKARKRRGHAGAEIVYRTLLLGLPMRQSIDDARREGGDFKAGLRLHMRRGGFAVYKPERPHVSGFVGAMWRSPTVVGSEKRGRVVKEYQVGAGDAAQERAMRKLKKKRKKNGPRGA